MERLSCSQDTLGWGWLTQEAASVTSQWQAGVTVPFTLPPTPTSEGLGPLWGYRPEASISFVSSRSLHKNNLGILVNYQLLKVKNGSHGTLTSPHRVVRP